MAKASMTLRIADFSCVPAGRYRTDGPQSGEVFREERLIPALKSGAHLNVILDGTEGYGSSFLEEAFAGALRRLGLSADQFRAQVDLTSDEDPSLVIEINGYLDDEDRRSAGGKRRS